MERHRMPHPPPEPYEPSHHPCHTCPSTNRKLILIENEVEELRRQIMKCKCGGSYVPGGYDGGKKIDNNEKHSPPHEESSGNRKEPMDSYERPSYSHQRPPPRTRTTQRPRSQPHHHQPQHQHDEYNQ
ncbi:hypothetical protein BLA29_011451, partial [Euroglyphus maynei]